MALYSIGASWNPEMSRFNRSIKRELSGLHGIKGIGFAYRLNQWGPKTGPAMLPATTFPGGYVQTGLSQSPGQPTGWPAREPSGGLASPFTWIQGVFGLESVSGLLEDASDILKDVSQRLGSVQGDLSAIVSRAQAYDSVTDATIQAKAQAVQAESAGLTHALLNIQGAYSTIQTEITIAKQDANFSKDGAAAIKSEASGLSDQVDSFQDSVDACRERLNDLIKDASSGPGIGETLTSSAVHSLSTLTWLLGGGALVYFLAPTFIPRLVSGIRKARA